MPAPSHSVAAPSRSNVHSSSVDPTTSERTVALLEECIEKLNFLGAIAPDVLQHRDELTAFVGGEISRIILDQRALEDRYESLITERGLLKGQANKTRYKAVQTEIQDVSHALRESTKSLCRNLKDNPNIAGNLSKIHRERSEVVDILTTTIAELQESGSFDSLQQRVLQDKRQQESQRNVLQKERETAAAVRQLDRDLASERGGHAHVVATQRADMATLKEQLAGARTRASVDVRFLRAETNARSASELRTFKQKEADMQANIDDLKARIAVEETVHSQTKAFLQKKGGSLTSKNDDWTTKYEAETQALEHMFASISDQRSSNLEVLMKLKGRREKEKNEAAAQIAAQIAAVEAKKAAEERKKKMDICATVIQGFIKLFLSRRREKNAAGGKGKKGGKEKKGKKGK